MALIKAESKEQFDQIIADNERVLVDFYADWCGPCKVLLPMLTELSDLVSEQFTFVKVNIEDVQELTAEYNVRSIPTLILFKDGVQVATRTGMASKVELLRFISDAN